MRRLVKKIMLWGSAIFLWTSAILGLLIIGGCVAVAMSDSSDLAGNIAMLTFFIIALLITVFVVGWVFLFSQVSGDVRSLRERMEQHPTVGDVEDPSNESATD